MKYLTATENKLTVKNMAQVRRFIRSRLAIIGTVDPVFGEEGTKTYTYAVEPVLLYHHENRLPVLVSIRRSNIFDPSTFAIELFIDYGYPLYEADHKVFKTKNEAYAFIKKHLGLED